MATFQCPPSESRGARKKQLRRFRVDLVPPGSGPVSGGVTVLATTKQKALVAIRSVLDAHTVTMTRSDAEGAILDLALLSACVSLADVYEVASGPSLGAFADKTDGVNVLEDSVIIDLPHGAWIRASRSGRGGSIQSNLAALADDAMPDEEWDDYQDAEMQDDGEQDIDGAAGNRSTSRRHDAEGAEGAEGADDSEEEAQLARENAIRFRAAVDTLESLVLAQYCAGIDVTSPQYEEALVTTWEAILNNCT